MATFQVHLAKSNKDINKKLILILSQTISFALLKIQHLKLPKVKDNIKGKTTEQIEVKSQVIVHCNFYCDDDMAIRIWQSTFLFDAFGKHQSKLLFAYNIPYYPTWQFVKKGKHTFTLIFDGLPKNCTHFHLIENAAGGGHFEVLNIVRNKTDVYVLEI